MLIIINLTKKQSQSLLPASKIMRSFAVILLPLVLQSTTASWPTYHPTVWDNDDGAASSNLGVKSDVTPWPTYSPTGEGKSGNGNRPTTNDYSSSNSTNPSDDDSVTVSSRSNVTVAATNYEEERNGAAVHGAATLILAVVATAICLN